jgi:GAF domain-containing protein
MHDPFHAEEFAEMALSLHEVESFQDTVDRVLEVAVKALNCNYAGVIVIHERSRAETVAATHPVVADLDAIQIECGEGPDLEVIADRHGVLVPDATRDERWPTWAQRVAETGVRSMLGTRLYTSTTVIGSLNFYDTEPDKFGAEDVDVAHLLARHAAVAMERARDTEHLWKAIDARNLIGQAQGLLMERFGVEADQAFAVLRRYSQDHNLKLHLVAQRLIETRSLPE